MEIGDWQKTLVAIAVLEMALLRYLYSVRTSGAIQCVAYVIEIACIPPRQEDNTFTSMPVDSRQGEYIKNKQIVLRQHCPFS